MEVENLVMDEISVRIELRKNSMQKGARKKERQFFNDFSQKKEKNSTSIFRVFARSFTYYSVTVGIYQLSTFINCFITLLILIIYLSSYLSIEIVQISRSREIRAKIRKRNFQQPNNPVTGTTIVRGTKLT